MEHQAKGPPASSRRLGRGCNAPFCKRSSPALCFTALLRPLAAAASFFCFSYK